MALVVYTEPTQEPVTVDEVKTHLRIDHANDDGLLRVFIKAAREALEIELGRTLCATTLQLKLDDFPTADPYKIELPKSPVQSVTSIKYYNGNGVLTTIDAANYQADTDSEPARVMPVNGYYWPTVQADKLHAVIVEYDAGYSNLDAIPQGIKHALFLLLGHWYENRESTSPLTIKQVPFALETLINQNRIANVW